MTIWVQHELSIATSGKGFHDLTAQLAQRVADSRVVTGLCHCFVRHTSASLLITENADPDVRVDLERYFSRLVPEGGGHYLHDAEGPDDMPAHIRSMWTGSQHSIPIRNTRLALGTWQGLYLWEHRDRPHRRHVLVSIQGIAEGA